MLPPAEIFIVSLSLLQPVLKSAGENSFAVCIGHHDLSEILHTHCTFSCVADCPFDDVLHTDIDINHLGELLHYENHIPLITECCQSLCHVLRVVT